MSGRGNNDFLAIPFLIMAGIVVVILYLIFECGPVVRWLTIGTLAAVGLYLYFNAESRAAIPVH